eukprot:jgi/Mesvir1/7366/Mv19169-RA.1
MKERSHVQKGTDVAAGRAAPGNAQTSQPRRNSAQLLILLCAVVVCCTVIMHNMHIRHVLPANKPQYVRLPSGVYQAVPASSRPEVWRTNVADRPAEIEAVPAESTSLLSLIEDSVRGLHHVLDPASVRSHEQPKVLDPAVPAATLAAATQVPVPAVPTPVVPEPVAPVSCTANPFYCGRHGLCLDDRCLCAAFYTGPDCKRPYEFPPALRPPQMANLSAVFEGHLLMNQAKVRTLEAITVHLPGKEDEEDGGFRTLAPVNAALLKALPDVDPLMSTFYRTCAIVGSSGVVLHYKNGRDIDTHDMVFRFNSAPTKGFEAHVGSKTTHRITNTQNWGFHESGEEAILIHMRSKSAITGLLWGHSSGKYPKLYAFDTDFVEYMAHGLSFLATSGLYGILIALQRCARVDLYGFQVSTQHGTLYHYYDVCDIPANVERDDNEWRVVKALADMGLVHFSEPCIPECHESPAQCDACKLQTGFRQVQYKSASHCAPTTVSRGHLKHVPWRGAHRKDRRKKDGHS